LGSLPLVAGLLISGCAGAAKLKADIIAGSLSNVRAGGPPITGSSAASFGRTSYAFAFTTFQTYNLQSITVPSDEFFDPNLHVQPPTVQEFNVSLSIDNHGLPGSMLGTVTGLTGENPVADFTSQSVSLAGDQTYWVVLTPFSANSGIYVRNAGGLEHYASTSDATGQSGWLARGNFNLAYQVSGTATPEPASFLLAAPGLAGLWFMRRKKAAA